MKLIILLHIILGYLFTDLIMGIYHWAKDTYGSPLTPIIGKRFIWNSRLHHIRPRLILDENIYDIIYSSFIWTVPLILPLMFLTKINLIFLTSLLFFISMNDVIHYYSHMTDIERPLFATILQNVYLLQSYQEHHAHHQLNHDNNYCPVSPYINFFLEKINFWRLLEQKIQYYTGIKPRETKDKYILDNNYPGDIKFI